VVSSALDRFNPRTEFSYMNSAAEKEYWLHIKSRGKGFLVHREMLGCLLLWFVMSAAQVFVDRNRSLRPALFACLIMLPIFVLYGYLNAGWKWRDLQNKYPD